MNLFEDIYSVKPWEDVVEMARWNNEMGTLFWQMVKNI